MQVFRIMGAPDKIIAFDELPQDLTKGFEWCRAEGFPRYWKEWLGKMKKEIPVPPEKDFLTGQVRYFKPIIEEDSFFYLVDKNINSMAEKWQEVCDYVKRNVAKDFRLPDKIEDMAKPLAPNQTEGITLEPEEVVVIPLPKEVPSLIDDEKNNSGIKQYLFKCKEEGCVAEFDSKRAIRMHTLKKHNKEISSEIAKATVSV